MAANERDERAEPFGKQTGSEQSKGGGYEGGGGGGDYASGKNINSSADGAQKEGGNGGDEGIKTPL